MSRTFIHSWKILIRLMCKVYVLCHECVHLLEAWSSAFVEDSSLAVTLWDNSVPHLCMPSRSSRDSVCDLVCGVHLAPLPVASDTRALVHC